jgi:hypothetical protein
MIGVVREPTILEGENDLRRLKSPDHEREWIVSNRPCGMHVVKEMNETTLICMSGHGSKTGHLEDSGRLCPLLDFSLHGIVIRICGTFEFRNARVSLLKLDDNGNRFVTASRRHSSERSLESSALA